jgi:uncharacterized membrane protein
MAPQQGDEAQARLAAIVESSEDAIIGKDWKGKLSLALYFAAIPLAFLAPWVASAIYMLVAVLWLIPDRRIERILEMRGQ